MTLSALLAVHLVAAGAAAQIEVAAPPVRYPLLPASAPHPQGFVPRGWAILGRATGDLNRDGRADIALLLQMRDPANVLPIPGSDRGERIDTNPYLLAIAFSDGSGRYRLAARNHRVVPRLTHPLSGDEPPGSDTISVDRGALLVFFQHLRGTSRYRFRWQQGAFRLIGYDMSGVTAGCAGTDSVNFLTRRARVTRGLISSDETRTAWRRVTSPPPPALDAFDPDHFLPTFSLSGAPLDCPREAE